MTTPSASPTALLPFLGRVLGFTLLWMALFFLPAGTLAYWHAWVVLGILVVPILGGYLYWMKADPELVRRRQQAPEQEPEQQAVIKLLSLLFVLTFLIPGFDYRLGWSAVPLPLVLAADLLLALGYALCFFVVRYNRFAGRTVGVEQKQQVTTSGPYAVVRHPMYSGVLLMCLALPLALGSYWALLPAVLILPVLVWRIQGEERLLLAQLDGYAQYRRQTRFRLIPGVW